MHSGDAPAAHARRSHRTARATLVVLAVALVILLLIAAEVFRRTSAEEAERASDPAFVTAPTPLPSGAPGSLIRSEEIDSAPVGTRAWRVLYHSRDLAGSDIAVSGLVVVPEGPAPENGRTVVSWAHPTTGAATACAPSLALDPFELIAGMHELLAEGYAVVATDYPGLGVEGASSYLLGVPEAHSVLDIVRAAGRLDGAGTSARVVLWGHSQGGQAALFAAERAETYAPELSVRGVAVAAPAADLNALMTDDIVDVSGITIASFAIAAYRDAYAERFGEEAILSILTPEGAAATPDMAALCLLTHTEEIHAIAEPLVGSYVTADPATTEPWRTMLAENSAGGQPITVPVLVGQGEADELVRPAATDGYVARLCAAGTDVAYHRFPAVDHGYAAYATLPELLLWLPTLDSPREPRDTCG
ncbi:lipase family protein [Microbacterium sp. SSW1-47]|uniref:alpha/beta fold hydrolase n=1 Tax=Microbacterium sufflavum TaxID=2851649 RepID=UPI001FFC8920|nr:alpha/beta fold hydrolase [Microbacterium sufflavum]MCK2027381.1 lipase family protein [Microbacterium sufflavum]